MKKVLIFDYHISDEILSGNSLLGQLKYSDRNKFDITIILNRNHQISYKFDEINFNHTLLSYGVGSAIKRFKDYLLLPFKIILLYFRYKPDLIHANSAMAARAAILMKFFFGVPLLTHLRNIGLPPRSSLVLNSTRFAAVSLATIKGTLPNRLHTKAEVVFDGLDLINPSPRSNENMLIEEEHQLIVGMCSRVEDQKGIKLFIDSAREITKKFNNVYFSHLGHIKGQDNITRFLSDQDSLNERFFWKEYINDASRFWESIDIAIVPSAGPEALGRVILESMSYSLPTIATKSGGPQEIIDHEENGFLIEINDLNNLNLILEELIGNKELRDLIGKNANKKVNELFSAQVYSKKMEGLYTQILVQN